MNRKLEEVHRRLKVAEVLRKKGSALWGRARERAIAAYEDAIRELDEALKLLPEPRDASTRMSRAEAADLAEVLGSRGGFLRRLDRPREALSSYRDGAAVEERHGLPSTYNRVNEVKWALLTGDSNIAALRDKIDGLVTTLRAGLDTDTEMSKLVWSWADLGDCLALLGRVDEAAEAYMVFIERADSQSPETTLSVLGQVADRLEESGSDEAPTIRRVVHELARRLEQA